jgi:hypothetical protein
MNPKNPKIDEYFSTLPEWEQDVCRTLRKIIHAADPQIVEVIKRTNRPYFVLNGNVCALLGTKDHVNLFVYDPIAEDPENVINQGSGNLTARSIQIYEDTAINETGIIKLLQNVIANNRVGGWRRLTPAN